MNVFADTFYFLALSSPSDAAHRISVEFGQNSSDQIVTTQWVLTEVADSMAAASRRKGMIALLDSIRSNVGITVVPASQLLFEAGWTFYRKHRDKDWSLTDCISFVVMKQKRLTLALTGEHHFEQAGFIALLKKN